MENKILKIDKITLYNDLYNLYDTPLTILENFKRDFNEIYLTLNNVKVNCSHEFLDIINKRFIDYLEKILMVCNKTIFTIIIDLIKKNLGENSYHIIQHKDEPINIALTINHLVKQIYITNEFIIIKLDDKSNIKLKKKIIITITLDLCNSEPILVGMYSN